MVYSLFCASDAVAGFCGKLPGYAYFTRVWKEQCSHIKLKKSNEVCSWSIFRRLFSQFWAVISAWKRKPAAQALISFVSMCSAGVEALFAAVFIII